jgi:hypothetical protein
VILNLSELCSEFYRVDRLSDELVEIALSPLWILHDVLLRCHCDDLWLARVRSVHLLEPLADGGCCLEAVHMRHVDVKEDSSDRGQLLANLLLKYVESSHSGKRGAQLKFWVVTEQELLKDLDVEEIVVDDEHTFPPMPVEDECLRRREEGRNRKLVTRLNCFHVVKMHAVERHHELDLSANALLRIEVNSASHALNKLLADAEAEAAPVLIDAGAVEALAEGFKEPLLVVL